MTVFVAHTNHYSKTDQFAHWTSRHWLFIASLLFGLYTLAPFLAPMFMAAGWTLPGRAIYWVYSFFCHQLPERSYFLFGPKISYTLPEIQSAWQNTTNFAILRQFVGNARMGWKVAWSDRMVSMFTSFWVFGILWGMFKKRLKVLRWWGLVLLLLPMALDGTTHMISDIAGLGQGFRDSNAWLAALTNHSFAPTFYAGDAWGSFNAWMRLVSGVLFGLGIVWYVFRYLDDAMQASAEEVEYKYKYREWLKKEKERLLRLSAGSPSGYENAVAVQQDQKGGS
jgi:uncharacterized membrane protein